MLPSKYKVVLFHEISINILYEIKLLNHVVSN